MHVPAKEAGVSQLLLRAAMLEYGPTFPRASEVLGEAGDLDFDFEFPTLKMLAPKKTTQSSGQAQQCNLAGQP